VTRPAINRQAGATLAFSKVQARKLLDLPAEDTIAGLRDRAILSVGLQVGLRRAEIAALRVGDLHQNRGYDSLRVTRKGRRRDALAINPQTAARLRAYLDTAGHAGDSDGRMFRPLKHNGKQDAERRHMHGVVILHPAIDEGRRTRSVSAASAAARRSVAPLGRT
jgi:integrase/recombinase XerD